MLKIRKWENNGEKFEWYSVCYEIMDNECVINFIALLTCLISMYKDTQFTRALIKRRSKGAPWGSLINHCIISRLNVLFLTFLFPSFPHLSSYIHTHTQQIRVLCSRKKIKMI